MLDEGTIWCYWVWLHVRLNRISVATVITLCCLGHSWLAALVLMRLAGFTGTPGHKSILVGLSHVHSVGCVSVDEVPVHWVDQPYPTCYHSMDGEIDCRNVNDWFLCVQHVGYAMERVDLLGLYL
jgi:hypothetical protein